jgi:hypothetical protein
MASAGSMLDETSWYAVPPAAMSWPSWMPGGRRLDGVGPGVDSAAEIISAIVLRSLRRATPPSLACAPRGDFQASPEETFVRGTP